MILVIDNYDSFTYNLVQLLQEISGQSIEVVRNDAADVEQLLATPPRAIVVSPGPGSPGDAGICIRLIAAAAAVPLLGVCLGHQALAVAHGGTVDRAPLPMHGKVSTIHHDGSALFADMPNPFEATRYHSLMVSRDAVPEDLAVTAWSDDGLIMALEHRSRPHFGVQFHPESYLSRHGAQLLATFLRIAGIAAAGSPCSVGGESS